MTGLLRLLTSYFWAWLAHWGQSYAIYTHQARKWAQRISEWLGGALCSIYGSELIASAIHHMLDKFDLIDSTYVVPEKLLGFAGFLCGALGVTVIDLTIKAIRKRFDPR